MKVIDFIKNNIKTLLTFESVQCVRYGISKWTGSHIIEITPSNVFSFDDFIDIESSISDKFDEQFPNEELIFISNDDIVSLSPSEVILFEMKNRTSGLNLTMDFGSFMVQNFVQISGLTIDEVYIESDTYQMAA